MQMDLVAKAIQALARAEAGGAVYDGPAYANYLRHRVQAEALGEKMHIKRPQATTLSAVHKDTRERRPSTLLA